MLSRFTLRIPKEISEYLKQEAKKRGLSRNALMIQILWDYLEFEKR